MSAHESADLPERARTAGGLARGWRALLASIRFDEVLVLQGAPLLGAILAIGIPTPAKLAALALFAVGSGLLVAHVFVVNDWAGRASDLRDPNRSRSIAGEGVTSRSLALLGGVLLLLALASLAVFGLPTLAFAVAIAALSALYSGQPWAGKGRPVVGSLLHLAGGVLHFHLGHSLYAPVGARSLLLSSFFALVFTAGHLTQEVGDYEADLASGIRTNAVAFGRRAAFVAGFALFATAGLLLVSMALAGVIPGVLVLSAPFFVLQAVWSRQTLTAGLTFENVRRLRLRYRALYAALGLFLVAAVLAR